MDLLCVKYIYTWKHLEKRRGRACLRRQKAAVCRILIGPRVCLMLVFDVFQGSVPRLNAEKKRWRVKKRREGERKTCSNFDFGGLWSVEGLRGFRFSPWIWPYCFYPSTSGTLTSIVFVSCGTEGAVLACFCFFSLFFFFKPPCLKLWSRAWQQYNSEECS